MEVVNVGQVLPTTLPIVTTEYRLIEVDIDHKITLTLPLTIGVQVLILKVEVDIGLRPANIPIITKVTVGSY